MEQPLKIIIIILAITAIGLGYLISQRMITEPTNISQPLPLVSGTQTSIPTQTKTSLPPAFTQDEALILKPPSPSGSKNEDIGLYYKTIDKLAKNSDTIQLGSQCYATPLVVSIKYGSKLNVTNTDIYDHILNFDGSTIYTIASKKTETITINFPHNAGIYAYSCDNRSPSGKIVGALKVMP